MAGVILAIGVLIFLAHFFTALFERKKIPDVLLLTALGIVLGPVTNLVTPEHFGQTGRVMSTLALIVILFESGIAINPTALSRALGAIGRLTFPTFAATMAVAYAIAVHVLGVTPIVGWMTGAILGGVSAAVAIPLVKSLRLEEPLKTALIMESALGDVLCIVILLGLVEGATAGGIKPLRIAGAIMASLLMAALIGAAGGFLWLLVLNWVRRFPNTIFTTLAMVFILYGVADELGYSGAIAALAFGVTLANCSVLQQWGAFRGRELGKLEPTDVSFFMEALFLLKTFFFVYLGVSVHFEDWALIGWAAVFCIAIYLARLVIVRIALPRESASWKELAIASLLVPKGLVAAVLAGIPVDRGVEGALLVRNFTYMVVVISISVTAVMIALLERNPVAAVYRAIFERSKQGAAGEPDNV